MNKYEIGGMVGVLVALIFGVFSFSAVDSYLLQSNSLAAVISAVLVDLTNDNRNSDNIGGLTVSPVLTAAAQAKANDMAAKGYFAHTSPDGHTPWYWFAQADYTFVYAGENLAVDFSDSDAVEEAWMNSPEHRANILNDHFTQIGIATAEGEFEGHPTTFVVQLFGTPAPTPAPTQVEVATTPAEATTPAFATAKPATKPAPTTSVAITPKAVAAEATTTPATTTEAAVTSPATTTVATSSLIALATPPSATVLGSQADSILPVATPWWERFIASPETVLSYAYFGFAAIILILLAYVTEFEFHRRHIRHVATAILLFVLMAGLFTLAEFTFFSHPVIAAFHN